jgi:hypothetical protein
MDVLDPDVVGWTDSGVIPPAPREPVIGRGLMSPNSS